MPDFPGRLRTPRLPSAPATPAVGETYYNTATSILYWWNGTIWVAGAPPLVTSLPASPGNGQECYLSLSNVRWHLRYESATTFWHFIGGGALVAQGTLGTVALTPSVGNDPPGGALAVAWNFKGLYEVQYFAAFQQLTTGGAADVFVFVTRADTTTLLSGSTEGGGIGRLNNQFDKVTVSVVGALDPTQWAAAENIRLRVQSGGGTGVICEAGGLVMRPVYLTTT